MEFKVGDKVSVLSEIIEGVIHEVDKETVVIHDVDGFLRTYLVSEIALKKSPSDYKLLDSVLQANIKDKIKEQIHLNRKPLRKFEIDLHMEELVDDHSYMTNHEILQNQMSVCKRFIQRAIDSGLKKIILIHGKGEGVLKNEIYLYLNKLSAYHEIGLQYHDASYSEYGVGGATEVLFE